MARFLRTALSPCFLLAVLLASIVPTGSFAQSSNLQYQVANVIEDLRLLDERIRRLTVQMEEMRRENEGLREVLRDYEDKEQARMSGLVSVAQLNASIKQAVAALEARDEAAKKEVLAEVAAMIQKLQETLTSAVASSGGGSKPVPAGKTHFPDNFPKTGVPYTVQPGDNLSIIAKKLNSRSDWIQNANKISDPRLLQVGQTIFVPQSAAQ